MEILCYNEVKDIKSIKTEIKMNGFLAENIRRNRKNKGMTQLQLADMLYVSPQTVSKWETGVGEPDTEKLCLMADIFEISLDSLVRNRSTDGEKAYIAIDGGGTKTEFVLFLESGEILESVTLGGSNPNAYGIERTKEILTQGIDRMIKSGACIEGIFAGISGASAGNNRECLSKYLSEKYPYFRIRVEGDIHNVINSIADAERCVAVICGTGSVAYAYDGHTLRRFGGWGYLFDEAGSGFDIGRQLFRHALDLEDAGKSDEISAALRDAVGGGIFDNISKIYAKGKDYIASFAPLAFELYDQGNSYAVGIVEECADRLAELIVQARSSADCGKTVIIAGGLTARRDILEPLIEKRVGDKIRLVFPTSRPIVGAAVKCLKLYGSKDLTFESVIDNFSRL